MRYFGVLSHSSTSHAVTLEVMAAVTNYSILLLLVAIISSAQTQNVQLTNNGYEGILVAISERVQYDSNLVPNIKVSLTITQTINLLLF